GGVCRGRLIFTPNTKIMSFKRKTGLSLAALALSLLTFFLVGELLVRLTDPLGVVSRMKAQAEIISQKKPPYNTAEKDPELGWKCKSDYTWQGTLEDAGGASYPVHISFGRAGFRKWGDGTSGKTRFLLIGDSYTQSVEVSDGKTFYDLWADSLDLDLWVYGMAGYGTLQEFMILEKYLDEINPDVIMLQFCANDFIDNFWELEARSEYKVGLRRPYLKDTTGFERIYVNPVPSAKRWLGWSAFYQLLDYTIGARLRQRAGTTEYLIGSRGQAYPPYRASIARTRLILSKMKALAGPDRPFYVLAADGFYPQLEDLRAICKSLDIWLMESGVHRMNEARDSGRVFHSSDGYHWNEYGHELMGRAVLNDLRLAGLKPQKAQVAGSEK
ncbi:MAG: SGNH/GDSL hydrolase family protein, partial [Bacteroidetes bacterium]